MKEEERNFLFEQSGPQNGELDFLVFFNLITNYDRKKVQNFLHKLEKTPTQTPQSPPKPPAHAGNMVLNKIEQMYVNIYKLRGRMKKNGVNMENFQEMIGSSGAETREQLGEHFKEFLRGKKIGFKDQEIQSIVEGVPLDSEIKCSKKTLS